MFWLLICQKIVSFVLDYCHVLSSVRNVTFCDYMVSGKQHKFALYWMLCK